MGVGKGREGFLLAQWRGGGAGLSVIRLLVPREPSVAGIMVYGFLASLLVGGVGVYEAVLVSPILLLHMASFDPLFTMLRRGRLRVLASLLALNAAPYLLVAVVLGGSLEGLVLAGLLAAVVTLALIVLREKQGPAFYVLGAVVPALPGLAASAALGLFTQRLAVFWALYALYTASTALYIESLLPHRRTPHWAALALWLPAIPLAAAQNPCSLAALVEPTAKKGVALARRQKIGMSRIKRLGVAELVRLTIYTVLLAASFKLC